MERIFKIRTKSNRNPMEQYPSERRYSASTVLGLSVMFFQLFLFSLLMGTLIIHRLGIQDLLTSNSTLEEANETMEELYRHIERLESQMEMKSGFNVNVPVLTCAACYVMSAGYLLSFVTGMFAWQRWYIDQNITFFFISSSFSTVTAAACLVVTLVALACLDPRHSPLSISLLMNVAILASVGTIWSILASRLSLKGLRNSYPDEVTDSKGRKDVGVTTVRKGSKGGNVFPPDIINHFPADEKLAKYLPKKEDNSLPKAESNLEYRQRVDKFLSGEPENSEK